MKRKLIECVAAYIAVCGLWTREADFRVAHALMMLKRRLAPHVQFVLEQEKMIKKANDDDKTREKKLAALHLTEVEVDERVRLDAPGKMTPEQVEALELFCEFGEAGI